jgi:hypothetical protein
MIGAAFTVRINPSKESATAARSGGFTVPRPLRSKWLLTTAAISSRLVPIASTG